MVSDVPLTPEGVKTEESDQQVTQQWADSHLQTGIDAMTEIGEKGEKIKHFLYLAILETAKIDKETCDTNRPAISLLAK